MATEFSSDDRITCLECTRYSGKFCGAAREGLRRDVAEKHTPHLGPQRCIWYLDGKGSSGEEMWPELLADYREQFKGKRAKPVVIETETIEEPWFDR